jgi:Ca-activated chloride channel family protein
MKVAGALLMLVILGGLILASGDRLGRLLLAGGYPALAAKTLDDPAWQGVAFYEAGNYQAAIAALKKTIYADTAYNLGNAFARNGDLKLAVKAYDIALKRNTDDEDASMNRKLVLAAIKAQEATDSPAAGSANATASRELSDRLAGSGEGEGASQTEGEGMVGDRMTAGQVGRAGHNKVDRRGEVQSSTDEDGKGSASGAASDTVGRAGQGGDATSRAESDKSNPELSEQSAEQELAQATRQWFASIPDDPLHFVRLRIQAERGRRVAAGEAFQAGGWQW